MKATYKTSNGRLSFEMQAESPKDLFREIAQVQEIFDSETACGCCQSVHIRFLARKVEDYDFYELVCLHCHARFAFGQAKKGGALFPKRKDETGNWLPNHGWSKYVKPGEEAADAPPAQQQRAAAPAAGSQQSAPPAASSAPPVQTKTGPDGIERRNGVPVFANWGDAEKSKAWGCMWMWVAGAQYRLTDGNYVAQAQQQGR